MINLEKKKKLKLRIGIFNERDQESLLIRHKKGLWKIPFLVSRTRRRVTPPLKSFVPLIYTLVYRFIFSAFLSFVLILFEYKTIDSFYIISLQFELKKQRNKEEVSKIKYK